MLVYFCVNIKVNPTPKVAIIFLTKIFQLEHVNMVHLGQPSTMEMFQHQQVYTGMG